ncbi:MAG: hypothetical protein LW808_002305 [Verrucomicrobiota bacterium]|nr:MAG: hypothetical protein LW808_002305 [Verrucomicrobiota bacterium]
MNCKIVKSLSLAGAMLATSFAFGEISPETEMWIQELIEKAKQSSKGAAFLTKIMSLMERYAALPQRLANPDTLTLMDAGFLPKFFSSLGHPLVLEQVPEILHVLKGRYPVADASASSTRRDINERIRRLIESVKDPEFAKEEIVQVLNIAEAYIDRRPLDADNPYTKFFFRDFPNKGLVRKLIAIAKKRLAPTDSVDPDGPRSDTSSTGKADDLVQWVMDKTKDPKMTAADVTSMIHDLEECIEALESGQPMSADNFWADRTELPSLERLQGLLRFLREHLSQLESTDTRSDDTTPEEDRNDSPALRKNGNIWMRGKIIEIQGTGVHRTTLQETIRNVGEYLAWRLNPDASDATLPHNSFVEELRGRKPDIKWVQKLIAVAKERLLKIDPAAVIDDPSAGIPTENPVVDKPTIPEAAVTPNVRSNQRVSPEALKAAKLKNRKLQVLVRESARCWKAMHEAYVKAAQDKLADYMAAHPDSSLHSLQPQLEQWYLESIHNPSEAEKALATMEKKLAEQQIIIDFIETRMKEYRYFMNVWLAEYNRRREEINQGDTPDGTVEAFGQDNPIASYTE